MEYWQQFTDRPAPDATPEVWRESYLAAMPDGRGLRLPLRDLGETAVAGLIANQASFTVFDALCGWMTEIARSHAAEIVVGLPTLGLAFAAAVARGLGHANWVAPGTSRKLWYEDALSVSLTSITSPAGGRRMWLDPRVVHRLAGRRVLLVDDVVSTGASVLAGVELLRHVGIVPVAVCAAMLQGDRWRGMVPAGLAMEGVFATPLFKGVIGGWTPLPGTARAENCLLGQARR